MGSPPQHHSTMEWFIWIACPNEDCEGWEDWYCCRFGYSDKAQAFIDAKLLRDGYPGHYVATLPDNKRPLPIKG
jgi:hypothetical protein